MEKHEAVEKPESITPELPSPVDDTPSEMESIRPVDTNNIRPACFKTTFQEIMFVLSATMAIAMTAFLSGIVTVISSFVGRELNMSVAELTWLAASTSLTNGAFLLFFGGLADMFGRKIMFVGSLFLFSIFCLAAGFANTAITVDVLCGVLGLFGASAVPPAVGFLGVVYDKPSKRKNYAFACFSAGNPLGFVFGTIFGGLATNLFGWRSSFWLLAIIFFVFTFIAMFSVPQDFTAKQPFTWETLKRFDIVGTILVVAGIMLLSAGLTLGGTAPSGWKTGYVIAFLILGVVLLAAFVYWETWFSSPLIPMWIWKDRNFSLVILVLSLGNAAFTPAAFFISLYLQSVWRMSALMVAVHLLPMAIGGILVNIFAGLVLHRISNTILLFIGAAAYMIADLLFALNCYRDSYWAFCFPALLLLVVGADLEFNVANMYVMSALPTSQQSVAGGIFQTSTKLAMTLGFGLATAVFNAVEKDPKMALYWDPTTQPFSATFWLTFALAALGVCLVPFLTIGTQGGKDKRSPSDEDTSDVHGKDKEASDVKGNEKEASDVKENDARDLDEKEAEASIEASKGQAMVAQNLPAQL